MLVTARSRTRKRLQRERRSGDGKALQCLAGREAAAADEARFEPHAANAARSPPEDSRRMWLTRQLRGCIGERQERLGGDIDHSEPRDERLKGALRRRSVINRATVVVERQFKNV